MAIFRNVNMNFWTDTRIVDDYTPEDRYFMLYALTNSYTNIIGCYEISIKQMSNDLGYTKDVIESLVTRFNNFHKPSLTIRRTLPCISCKVLFVIINTLTNQFICYT